MLFFSWIASETIPSGPSWEQKRLGRFKFTVSYATSGNYVTDCTSRHLGSQNTYIAVLYTIERIYWFGVGEWLCLYKLQVSLSLQNGYVSSIAGPYKLFSRHSFVSLASTFVLTRISVVHHAALNCIRRVFAIIVTSIAFSIPITFLGAAGILISVAGFLAFTHYKVKRQQQPKPISTLLPMSAV